MRRALRLGWPIMLALVLRLTVVAVFASSSADGEQYIRLGRNLREHRVLSLDPVTGAVPTYARNPGYPAIVALLLPKETPADRTDEFRRLALFNSLCDGLTALAILLLALRLGAGEGTAVAAVAVYALWPVAWAFTPYVLTESLATVLGAWAMVFALAARPSWRSAVIAGVLLGLGYLVRVDVLVLLPAVAVVALRLPGQEARRQLIASALGILVVATPWWVRNLRQFGALHPVGSEWVDRYGTPLPTCMVRWFRTWCHGSIIDADFAGAIYWRNRRATTFVYPMMADSPDELDEVRALAARLDTGDIAGNDPPFCALAAQRARAHPLRTWLWLPFRRARELFFLPRPMEYPMRIDWMQGTWVRRGFTGLNVALWIVAAAGALLALIRARRRIALAALPLAVVARVVLHAYAVPQFVGPRFVVEATPFAAILIALLGAYFWPRSSKRSTL